MPHPIPRALRYGVHWPVRVRPLDAPDWSPGRSVNISTSGVLVELGRQCRVGEIVELEVDFLSPDLARQTVGAIGRVIRIDGQERRRAAIRFDVAPTAAVARASA